MTKLFIWGTLTTMVNGGGRNYFKKGEETPIKKMTYEGIEGELYEVGDDTLKTLNEFERRWGYVPVTIVGDIIMYVKSPVYDGYYWKNMGDFIKMREEKDNNLNKGRK